jgi:hypothetical protein
VIGIPFSGQVLEQIKRVADSSPTEEVGGVISNGEVIQLRNTCVFLDDGYIPPADEYIALLRDNAVDCFWHSHVNDQLQFSSYDINAIRDGGDLPWLLFNQRHNHWEYKDPRVIEPYLGRHWEQSWTDCYTLIRDFLTRELSIGSLPVIRHNGDSKPWLDPAWNEPLLKLPIYANKIADSEKPRNYDIALFKGLHSPGHMGLLLESVSGGLKLLHHRYNRFSEFSDTFDFTTLHSIWRLKCTISQLDSMETWDIDTENLTASGSANLKRGSAT